MRALMLSLVLVAGCGLSDDKTIADLSDKQKERLCEELASVDPVSFECEGVSITYEPEPVSACVARFDVPAGCIATVGDQRDCVDLITEADCTVDTTVGPCAALFDETCLPTEL